MSNSITDELVKGTSGELLVQLHLLQYGVQAAPPLKDSGNDLIAIRRNSFHTIQVKTVTGDHYQINGLPELYTLLAVVQLAGYDETLFLDKSQIFLIPQNRVPTASRQIDRLGEFALCEKHIDSLFERHQ